MINTAYLINREIADPYSNLAVEEALFTGLEARSTALFLWQNVNTVVIGRNQNGWSECRVAELEADGGSLARRLTGGGAVYHDAGNLNFSFLVSGKETDPPTSRDIFFSIVLDAVRSLGIDAELTGRNDLVAGGKKISGNAFLSSGDRYLHHGTILVSSDLSALTRYLSPPEAKTASHGVASVRSRVCNLNDIVSNVTVDTVRQALARSFSNTLGIPLIDQTEIWLNDPSLAARRKQFADPTWLYGQVGQWPFSARTSFSWGQVELKLNHDSSKVRSAILYSDSLDPSLSSRVAASCIGKTLSAEGLAMAISDSAGDEQTRELSRWVATLGL